MVEKTIPDDHRSPLSRAVDGARGPARMGLYDPRHEHDSCGVGFVAHMRGEKSHKIIADGLSILKNLTHRGAVGADPLVGDGAGMLTQIPDHLLRREMAKRNITLPPAGTYGLGQLFMPRDAAHRAHMEEIIAGAVRDEGYRLIGYRDVPVDAACLSTAPDIVASEPVHRQMFVVSETQVDDQDAFERRLLVLRKVIANRFYAETKGGDNTFYIVSLSCRTVVYKGMFLAEQLGSYYRDLTDTRYASAMAIIHQRFSTNTFPSWKLAQPFRMVAHNGEFNTLRGNANWMAARQASLSSPLFGDNLQKIWPVSYDNQSDTACFDNALEFLVRGGYSLAHAMMMLIPEAWADNPLMAADRRAFYEYHAALMEPWDGPAAVTFTDGRQIGATLDRNGLRPARFVVTDDDVVVMASEVGVLPIDEKSIVRKWRP